MLQRLLLRRVWWWIIRVTKQRNKPYSKWQIFLPNKSLVSLFRFVCAALRCGAALPHCPIINPMVKHCCVECRRIASRITKINFVTPI
ncbi:Uncharacterised protein [Vibrio cholerae]|nr:Uncharacterised protein [Vibrio cholerae]